VKVNQFKFQLTIRLVSLFLSLLLLAFAIAHDWGFSLMIALTIVSVFLTAAVTRYINSTNRELESFLAGLRFGDFQQTYRISHLGPSFEALEHALQTTVEKFKSLRSEKERLASHYRTLVQHVPIPLFIVHTDGQVQILNHATRRTFNVAEIAHIRELERFGAGFQRDVTQIQPGEHVLTHIELAGTVEYFIMVATQLSSGGRIQKLISLQNVQGELDATELATWQDLLRVTSHEILNSLAPVTSCAQTAKSLMDEVIEDGFDGPDLVENLHDIRASVDTVLRRSEGLTRFIQSYRQLSRLPPPKKRKIVLLDYFRRLESLVADELARKQLTLKFEIQPQSLTVMADEDMLDQALINLIRNASDALEEAEDGVIALHGYADGKQRTVIEVRDNGPGISPEVADRIFVPFFTTRQQGSGVGLALVRYCMLSHGGAASFNPNSPKGSIFRLVF
jgi:nitrogen fixation/metabolism regulation signal transduction histidine kinase